MWSFINPAFLFALGAAAIPLLLHLLQKKRKIQMPFSTVRFLKLAQRRSASRVRLENILLWLLRTAILVLLALAFAMPVLRTSSFGSFLGEAQRDVAIVWDVSYSMTYESGRTRVWDDARSAATGIINSLRKGDRVCIFLAGDDVTPLLAQPTSDLDLARTLVKAQEPRLTSSRLKPAITAALAALKEAGTREHELFVITDGQALPWTEVTGAELPPTFVALLGSTSPQNVAPLTINVLPALLLTNTTAQLTANLGQTGAARDTTVTLYIDDKEIARRSATTAVQFALPLLPPGLHRARLETPSDPLALDNTFYFLLRVRERLPVLLVASEADGFFLTRALNPTGSLFDVKRIEPDALAAESLTDYSCLLLANALPLPGQALLNVEKFVQGGGTLVIFPGDRATAADYASWICLPAKPIGADDIAEPVRQPIRLRQPRDPLFADLKLPPGSVPAITARRQLTLDGSAPAAPQTQPLLTLADTAPLLLAREFGKGRVLLFTVAADRRWSDLPLSPIFLPIVHQIVQVSAGATAGQLFEWGDTPGFSTNPDRAINLTRAESNLAPIDPGKLPLPKARVASDVAELLRQIQEHRQGRPLAELFLWLVLALATLELFFANRAARPAAKFSTAKPEPARVP